MRLKRNSFDYVIRDKNESLSLKISCKRRYQKYMFFFCISHYWYYLLLFYYDEINTSRYLKGQF